MGLRKLNIPLRNFAVRSTAADGELVCVTGNWSLLGSWIVKLLLEQGYTVKCTVPHTAEEVSSLLPCHGAQERLCVSQVDLLDYCSLAELFDGCSGVFHVPGPKHDIDSFRDYPGEAVDMEVRSVLNVVEACSNTPSVRKLVLTSCLSTVLWDRHYYSTGMVLDEKNWSDLDFCRKQKMWSALCKTMAEKAAWALALDKGLDLVVLNPGTVVGPKKLGGAARPQQRWSSGGPWSSAGLDQTGIFAYVHVDSLASAHVLGLQSERACGRYICFERLLSKPDILEAARELYPNYPMSRRYVVDVHVITAAADRQALL